MGKAINKKTAWEPWLPEDKEELTVTVNRHALTFTHLDKLYWPKEKITKRDLLNYYHAVAPYMLPYLKDRPQSLNRHPNGIEAPAFYQKNVGDKIPEWLSTYEYQSESEDKIIHFLVCRDEASLLYMASQGCIEINPWHSRVQSPGNPDWCVIDLDPDGNSYNEVVEAARVTKQVLDTIKAPAFCKTSGATGMHICIPLGAKYSYDQSRKLAQLIVTMVHEQLPSFTSLERAPAKRKGKLYLDYLQNRSIQTIAAPYSVRPRPGATVSAPLHWEEVKKGLSPRSFTMFNILARIKSEGDPFAAVLKKGISLDKALGLLQALHA